MSTKTFDGISIFDAFMERNDLKKKIVELSYSSITNIQSDVALDDTFNSVKRNPQEALEEALQTMDVLSDLNYKITEANIQNNRTLRLIETKSAQIALLTQVYEAVKNFKDKARSYTGGEGGTEIIQYKLNVNAEWVKETLDRISSEKRALERKLARNNASIFLN